jgi:steroid 5-alpha reductase family enzyme
MALIDSAIVFVVNLLIGALGIYVGARVLTNTDDYRYALVTALIGAVVWTLVAFLIGWIPLLGPIVALIAYVAVVNYRYPGGWLNAIGIALIAWVASLVVLALLATLEVTTFEAAGVPGV